MDTHASLLKQLLPISYDANGRVLAASLQSEGNALDAAVLLGDQLLVEDDPRTALQLMPEWERVLGNCAGSKYQIGAGKYSITQGELVDFSRASAATYLDGGVLKYAAVNEPRFEDGKLLIEPYGVNYASAFVETYYNTNIPAFSPITDVSATYPAYSAGTKVYKITHVGSTQCQANIGNMLGMTGVIFYQVAVLKNQGVISATVQYWGATGSVVPAGVTIDTSTGAVVSGSAGFYEIADVGNYWRIRLRTSGSYPDPAGTTQFPIVTLNGAAVGATVVYSGMQVEVGAWTSYHGDTSFGANHVRSADIAHAWMPLSIQQRRSFLTGKLNEVGGQSKQYFIDLAKSLGFVITIDEFWPANVMADVMAPLYTPEWYFVWRINAAVNANYRQATVLDTVMDAFASWGNADFEAAMREDAPAHTQVLFAYN